LSFALDGWTALGGRVSVSLINRVAVLVGRNGAGKSAILEGFEVISSSVLGNFRRPSQFDIDNIPKILEIEILTPTERRLHYKYELVIISTSSDNDVDLTIDNTAIENSDESQFTWNESCQYIDGVKEILWTIEMGTTTFDRSEITTLESHRPPDLPMLRYLRGTPRAKLLEELIPERQWVYDVLRGVRLLGKTAIRQTYIRRPCLLQVSRQRITPTSNVFPGKLDRLVRKIFRMKTEELNEFESICQRIGLARKITIEKFILSEAFKERAENENEKYIISVLLDGVNIGLLSDGTLRVLSLIIELIDPPPSVTTIIEEPETQIHPGMLAKLLNEIDTYTFGQNLILSTHSPQVVGWSSPDKINLVYRNHGQTIVRKLDEEEIQKVVEYLHEEGDLGEWLYSGIFDD
jgi:predicted ATP-binding protein involved in virulence